MTEITLVNDIIEVKESRLELDTLIFGKGKAVVAIDANKYYYKGAQKDTKQVTIMVDKIVCYG